MGDQFDRRWRPERDVEETPSRSTVGKRTLVDTLEYGTVESREPRGPDITPIQVEGQLGNVRVKGALKFDSKSNGLATIRTEGQTGKNKLELGSIEGALKTSVKGTMPAITSALLNETYYLSKFPWPLDGLQPKVVGKLLDTDGSLEGTKLFSVGFAVEGQLPDSLLPEWARPHYKLVLECAVEVSVAPTDLETLRDMRGMVDRALEAGKDMVRIKDQVLGKRTVIEGLAKRRKELELLQQADPRAFTRAAQSELATVTNQLKMWTSELGVAERRLTAITKLFGKLHDKWVTALSKLSPLLTKVRGPLVEKLCVRLLPLLGKLVGKLHPFLLIVTTAIDLAYLVKFLYDLCQGSLRYAGLGGDYEPDLFDWSTPGKDQGNGSKTGDGDGATTETKEDPSKAKLETLGGPRTRLAHALIHGALEGAPLEPRHYERLFAILERVEVTGDDVDKILREIVAGMTPDAALAALEAYFQRRDDARKASTTDGTTTRTTDGDGDGKRKGNGDRDGNGDGKRKGNGDGELDGGGRDRQLLGARLTAGVTDDKVSGGTPVPWTARGGVATLVVGRSPDGGAVTVQLEGTTAVRDGTIEFRPRQPGVRRVTTTEKRWNPATRSYDVVEGEMLLVIPPVMTKPVRGVRRRG
jgi:hypothetical protein